MPQRGRTGRVRTWAVVMAMTGALALGTGCGLKDNVSGDDDNKGNKAQSTGGSAPAAGGSAPPAAAPGGMPPAGSPPGQPSTAGGGGGATKPGGVVGPPEVCAVLPAEAVSAVLKTTVVSQPDNVPFSCDFRADGKSVLSTSRTLNTILKPGDETAPVDKAVTEDQGTRLDDQVGAPAALSTDGRYQKLVLTVKLDDKNFLKVTISPAGTAKDLDQAGMVTLAKAVVAAVG